MNEIDEVTGVEDLGFGPVVKLEVICNKCNSVCKGKLADHYGCDKCDSWVKDVRFRSVRMYNDACV